MILCDVIVFICVVRIAVRKGGLLSIVNGILVDLPSPRTLTYFWGFGSLLGVFLLVQLVSGVFLSIHYVRWVGGSFDRVVHIMRDVEGGWFVRVLHSNGARGMFLFMFIHVGRGLYYDSYLKIETWFSGVRILILAMGTAFLGYVLP